MKKLFLFFIFLIPFLGFAEDDNTIVLHKETGIFNEENRHETATTSFSAQLLTNNLIKVQASDITSFEVRIFDAEDNSIQYEGSTTNGILHITTSSLSAGHYLLQVKGDGFKYVGEFVIGCL